MSDLKKGCSTVKIGAEGEDRAAKFLSEKGYTVISRNWRTNHGEIDIIACKDSVLVFVEVKTLPNATKDMLQTVLNTKKQERILKTSKRFLLNYRQYSNCYIRFDVILIDMPGYPSVYHIENAFSERI